MKTLRLTFEIDTVSEEVDLGPILDALHEISRDLAYILFDTTDLGSEPLSELEESLEQSACAELKQKQVILTRAFTPEEEEGEEE